MSGALIAGIRSCIASIVQAPTVIDTDVNCAAIAEMQEGAARGLDRICHVTISTGIVGALAMAAGLADRPGAS